MSGNGINTTFRLLYKSMRVELLLGRESDVAMERAQLIPEDRISTMLKIVAVRSTSCGTRKRIMKLNGSF